MDKIKIKEQFLISPFLVFFLVNAVQTGVGVLGFQRIIAKPAGNDGWIAIIIASLFVHLFIWMIYHILKDSEGDIFSIHQSNFGKWIGGAFSCLFIVYLILMSLVTVRSYLEIIQVWIFPEINGWIFSLLMLLLAIYVIYGGFRTVVGICFFSVTLTSYLLLTMIFPLEFANMRSLLPIFNHSIKEIAMATKDMTLTLLGFEILFVCYPFIKNPLASRKWAHFGALFTTISCLIYGVTAYVFFNEHHLEKKIWATLSMWGIVEIPIVERFEYIGIASWLLVILPNLCITLWAASRGIKRLFNVNQKVVVLMISAIVIIIAALSKSRQEITLLMDILSVTGFYFLAIYLPFLFLFTIIKRKVRSK